MSVAHRDPQGLISCDTCGSAAFVARVDDEFAHYECAASSSHHWTEERDPECERCAQPLSAHAYTISAAESVTFICPPALRAHTFSQRN